MSRRKAGLLLAIWGCGRTPLDSDAEWRPTTLAMGGTSEQLTATGGTAHGASSGGSGGISQPTSGLTGATGGFVTGGTSASTGGGPNAGAGGDQAPRKTARWIATGAVHTCAVLTDGSIECWGTNESGELGDGTFTRRLSPVKVQGITNAAMVTTAYDHTCAILTTGAVQCWGSNRQGQLGNGTSIGSALPIAVGAVTGALDIDTGGLPGHTCALGPGSRVYCWGNSFSDPNNPNNRDLAWPNAVPGLEYSPATAISVGIAHSCALLWNGAVACWGSDSMGQLGDATTSDSSVPVAIVGLSSAIAIAAGGDSTCVVTSGQQVQCWGENSENQLGNAELTAAGVFASSTPVTVDGVTSATMVATGSLHACARILDGTLRCWGSNTGGELGDGTVSTMGKSAVVVVGVTSATRVAAGLHHSCAIVNGRVLCWGSNLLGQLGVGSTVDSAVPLVVEGY